MKPRMPRYSNALPKLQRGAVIVLVVVALAAMLIMAALALDGGHMLLNKTRLQNAVDAAALSGAKTLQPVVGDGNASTLARDAAWDTLLRNANAEGNDELLEAFGTLAQVQAATVVELSNSVYGPFDFPGPVDATYVRVSVPDYPLTEFFWGFVQTFGSGKLDDKAVAAIATAGPSPSMGPCKIEPIVVCGDPNDAPNDDPNDTSYWGYEVGDLEVLKSAANNDPALSSGNFQLLRLDDASGANDLRTALAGGIEKCNVVGEEAPTEPGNKVGPVAQGLNTRFGEYTGPGMNATDYPPDWATEYNDPKFTYDESDPANPQVEYNNQPITESGGDLFAADGAPLYDLNDWLADSAACALSGSCEGAYERRMLNIVIGDCTDVPPGQADIPVLDFGCYFLLQTVNQGGNVAQVFGQFVKECEGTGVAGPNPIDDVGPVIIQLYKTYIDNNRTPSKDS